MVVARVPVLILLHGAAGAMNLGRRKVFYPVSGNNRRLVCSLIAIGIQNLCTLKMCEDLREAIAQRINRNPVKIVRICTSLGMVCIP